MARWTFTSLILSIHIWTGLETSRLLWSAAALAIEEIVDSYSLQLMLFSSKSYVMDSENTRNSKTDGKKKKVEKVFICLWLINESRRQKVKLKYHLPIYTLFSVRIMKIIYIINLEAVYMRDPRLYFWRTPVFLSGYKNNFHYNRGSAVRVCFHTYIREFA